MTGVELIARERQEQIEKHGWTAEHDDAHGSGELAEAASVILRSSWDSWPFEAHWADKIASKPYVERLTIAGALIAAEIDREMRANS